MFANLLYKSQITGYLLYNAEQQVQKMVSLAPPNKAAQAMPNLLPPATNESPMELSGTIKVFTEVRQLSQ
jgi:triacylglycerol esterase/lipase EstA (alpha/beta hydrolase family)